MPDLVKFLDKKPTHSFTLGPSGLNIAQTGFSDLWRAWYEEDVGITFVKENEYNYANPTGHHASGSQDILFAHSISATFDSGAFLWTAFDNFSNINIFRHSGNGYTTQATFSGLFPTLYYNVANNIASRRYVHCFYLKSGENKIFARSNEDNFSSEYVFHQDFDRTVSALKYVSTFSEHANKISVMGLYDNGDGFELITDCFYLFETGAFTNFSQYANGEIDNLNDWECGPADNFTNELNICHENFVSYPTGIATTGQFNSGTNISGGYTYQWV